MKSHLIESRPSLWNRAARHVLRAAGVHPEDTFESRFDLRGARALCIATNHGTLDLGVPTGVFGSELTVPYYAFVDAGLAVDVASCRGGLVPVEPLSLKEALRTAADDRLLDDEVLRHKLEQSLSIAELDFASYDLVYLAGGWGAAFDLGQSEPLGHRMSAAFAAGRVLGGICHGPLGLLRARRPDGTPLVRGLRMTAVTDRQVRQLGVSLTPLHPESELRAAGARFECVHHPLRDFLANHFVADGNVVTGQNQNAGPMVARRMLQLVQSQRASDASPRALAAHS